MLGPGNGSPIRRARNRETKGKKRRGGVDGDPYLARRRRTADELDRLGCVRPFRSFPSRDPRETDPNPTKAGPNAASTGTRHAGDWRLHLTTHSQSPSLSDLKLLSLAQISRASRMSLRINPSDLSLRVCPPWLSNALSIGQGGRSMEVVRPPLLNAPIGLDAAEPASPQPRRPPRH